MTPLSVIVLGLSITSSWGNGHATTYRSLLSALARRGHRVRFLERDVPWYASQRDGSPVPGVEVALYDSIDELRARFGTVVRDADLVIVGSYVPDGCDVGRWVIETTRGLTAFYDIDTPLTLAALADDSCAYISRALLCEYDLVLSFAGGATLTRLEHLGARIARPLYCAVDPDTHRPQPAMARWALGYLGTYAADRQPGLEAMLLEVARRRPDERFVVAGPQYPERLRWPPNIDRMDHVEPAAHGRFFAAQRLTLNLTREPMRRLGHSPSVRLFEAAACGAAIVSDEWPGLSEIFRPHEEVLPVRSAQDVEAYLDWPEGACRALGARARARVLAAHTADHRAAELERWAHEAGALSASWRAPIPVTEAGEGVVP